MGVLGRRVGAMLAVVPGAFGVGLRWSVVKCRGGSAVLVGAVLAGESLGGVVLVHDGLHCGWHVYRQRGLSGDGRGALGREELARAADAKPGVLPWPYRGDGGLQRELCRRFVFVGKCLHGGWLRDRP
jgi:hypothetical protein